MELIADLIEASLEALFDLGVEGISDEMESFITECEIEYVTSDIYLVTFPVLRWELFISHYPDGKMHSYCELNMDTYYCGQCGQPYALDELQAVEGGYRLCRTCLAFNAQKETAPC